MKLEFLGHYDEPNLNLKIPFDLLENMQEMIFLMKYYPAEGKWESVTILDKNLNEQGPTEFVEEPVQRTQKAPAAANINRSNS